MNNIKIFCSWELNFNFEHEKQVELYVDTIPSNKPPEGVIRFVFLLEPIEILNLNHYAMKGMRDGTYHYLLTHNEDLLDGCPNSHLFEFGSTWIRDYDFPEKEFSISALVGGKLLAPGHHFRHLIWSNQKAIVKPKKFYISGNYRGSIPQLEDNPILGSDKKPLFDSQFHICIENSKRKNWFTEKLIDCLETKTVPIYYGCPNIGDWFDERGFIIVNDLKEIIEACNKLTPEIYEKMLPYVEYNFKKSKDYTDIAKRLKDKIIQIIKNEKLQRV